MSDPIIPDLRGLADWLKHNGYFGNSQLVRNAADRLEALTRAKDVPEGSHRIRMAVVACDGSVEAVWLPYEDSDHAEALRGLCDGLDIAADAWGVVEFYLPKVVIPTVAATTVEEAK
jgi:hypothetical protein